MEIKLGSFYRINGSVLCIVRYTEYVTGPQARSIHLEGILPVDYPAYVAQHYIGENEMPYRTIADMEGIPSPEPIEIDISSDATIERIGKVEALHEHGDAMKILREIRSTAQLALELGRTHPLEYQIGDLRNALEDIIKLCEQRKQGA